MKDRAAKGFWTDCSSDRTATGREVSVPKGAPSETVPEEERGETLGIVRSLLQDS